MPWSGSGTFNRTDGTRTGSTVWAQAKAAGVKIVTAGHDTHDEDLADGIEACWNRNGENALTADVSAGGFSITNLADGAADGEALAYGQATPEFTSNDGGADAGPTLSLYRNSSSPAADDLLGQIRFDGEDSAGNRQVYARFGTQIQTSTAGATGARAILSLMQAGTERDILRVNGATSELRLKHYDTGATQGPTLKLHRDSASPADEDVLGGIDFNGEDDGSNDTTYARIAAIAGDVTDTEEDGALAFSVNVAGTVTEVMRITSPGADGVLIGKTAADNGVTAGVELETTGTTYIVRSGGTPLVINRLSDDGTLIALQQAGNLEGSISVSGATVTYGTFTGAHDAQWAPGCEPSTEPDIGTLLSATGDPYERDRPKPQLVKVKVTDRLGDCAVYGVYGGRTPQGEVQVWALGTVQVRVNGACEPGDLLWSSAEPGVAEVQPGDVIRASTLGKVTGRKGPGEGLVAAVLYSG